MKKTKHFFAKHPVIYSIIIAVILIIIGFAFFKNGNEQVNTLTVHKTTFKRQVSVSGKVVAAQKADLGFEQGGRLGSIQSPIGTVVKKGSVIASLENGDIRAELLQKEAALEREQAKLNSLVQGTREEQLTIDKQEYTNATKAYVNAMNAALLDTEYTLQNEVDVIFENGSTGNPNIKIPTQSRKEETDIERDRTFSTQKIESWKASLSLLTEPVKDIDLNNAIATTNDSLKFIKSFIDRLVIITGRLSNINSGLTQAEIDSYRASINSAGQTLSKSIVAVQTNEASWNKEHDSLALSLAGSTAADINAQTANVKAARADVESTQARLRKTLIIAPFDGTVTRMDIKVGEIISSNSSQISLMSTNAFNIESFVPEVHIAYIQPNNKASVILDAYDAESKFNATVISIDPAETIRDGVSTYKVTLAFDQNDSRIKSGMTGSITIVTLEKPDSIVIPQSAVVKHDNQNFVYKISEGETTEVAVEVGSSTSLGQLEILSGINEGDEILVTAPTK